ncbi:MAG: glycosyltransferase family 2 protein [Pyrinomonadaceae bacterium]
MEQLTGKYLSIVVPAYNEAPTLRPIIERVIQVPDLLEVIIVDDGSTDDTAQIAANLAMEYDVVKFVRLEQNAGKTAALRAGFGISTGDVVVIQDADLEYDPDDIPELVRPIREGFADVVYGSRFMVKRAARVLYYYHYVANTLLTLLSNTFTNLNFTDVSTCYKAFRGDLIRNIQLTSSGFGFCIEVTAKIAKLKCVMYEVPISYYGRTYEEGKKIKWPDGVMAFYNVFRYNLFCSRKSSFKTIPTLAPKTAPAPLADTDPA